MSKFNPQPKQGMPAKKAKKRIRYKKRDTGQVGTFEEIAAEREWKCFVTGETLRQLTASNFAHVLSKAMNRYYKFKTYKKNIVLVKDDIHDTWDKKPRSHIESNPMWKKMFDLEAELKQEYKELYG